VIRSWVGLDSIGAGCSPTWQPAMHHQRDQWTPTGLRGRLRLNRPTWTPRARLSVCRELPPRRHLTGTDEFAIVCAPRVRASVSACVYHHSPEMFRWCFFGYALVVAYAQPRLYKRRCNLCKFSVTFVASTLLALYVAGEHQLEWKELKPGPRAQHSIYHRPRSATSSSMVTHTHRRTSERHAGRAAPASHTVPACLPASHIKPQRLIQCPWLHACPVTLWL